MLYVEDPKSINGHIWILENRKNSKDSYGGKTYRALVLAPNQFGMKEDKALNPASRFGNTGERPAWENCVDGAFKLVNNGINAIPKPPGKDGADFTYTWTHKYGGNYVEGGTYPDGKRHGDTWFYNK